MWCSHEMSVSLALDTSQFAKHIKNSTLNSSDLEQVHANSKVLCSPSPTGGKRLCSHIEALRIMLSCFLTQQNGVQRDEDMGVDTNL